MLEVGKTFIRGGKTFCLIELLHYNSEKYAVFSVEDDKISFKIYKVVENDTSYDFVEIDDDNLKYTLYNMIEKEL